MNNRNWLKLNRSILTSNVFDNPKLLKVWIWCLCKASHKERDQLVGRQVEHLKEGQFIFGRKSASEELGMPESSVYNYFTQLKQMGNINIKSNNKYSVVTVRNWRFYQCEDKKRKQQNEQQMNNKRTTNEQQMNTNKNVKNEKNVKNVSSSLKRREEIRKKSEQVLKEINGNGSKR